MILNMLRARIARDKPEKRRPLFTAAERAAATAIGLEAIAKSQEAITEGTEVPGVHEEAAKSPLISRDLKSAEGPGV